eukprot:NODE_237_length_11991_cov_1.642899.p4 type:complete len:445 gc:universal NODE_237_length_11991_cov_1.642899:7357-8691(+)
MYLVLLIMCVKGITAHYNKRKMLYFQFNPQFCFHAFPLYFATSHDFISLSDSIGSYYLARKHHKVIKENGTHFGIIMFFTTIFAHSYMTCSDYHFDTNKCCGFGRNYDKGFLNTGKLGYKYQGQGPNAVSVDPQQTVASYGSYPMAQVKPGGTLIITWPPNNHNFGGNSDGGSPNVDKVFIFSAEDTKTPIATLNWRNCLGLGTIGNPQQNLPQCSGAFKVNLALGTHALIWAWQQNKEEAYYTTGFDVLVTNTPSQTQCYQPDIVPQKPEGVATGANATTATNATTAATSAAAPAVPATPNAAVDSAPVAPPAPAAPASVPPPVQAAPPVAPVAAAPIPAPASPAVPVAPITPSPPAPVAPIAPTAPNPPASPAIAAPIAQSSPPAPAPIAPAPVAPLIPSKPATSLLPRPATNVTVPKNATIPTLKPPVSPGATRRVCAKKA